MQRYRVYRRFGEISKFSQIALILILMMSMLPVGLLSLTSSNTSNMDLNLAPMSTMSQSAPDDVELKNQNKLDYTQETQNVGLNNDPTRFPSRLNQDLWAYYNFDEGSGTTVLDQSGNGNDGTIDGGANFVPGVIGTALNFDGVDDRVQFNRNFYSQDALSISYWMKTSSYANSVTLSQFTSGSAHVSISFGVNSSGYYYFGSTNSSDSEWWWESSTNSYPLNSWVNLALVFDDLNGEILMYVNGTLELQRYWDGSIYAPSIPDFSIGWRVYPNLYETSVIDEVRIYNATLSSTDIKELYLATDNPYNFDLKWTTSLSAAADIEFSSGDLTGDGKDDLVYTTTSNTMIAVDNNGTVLFDITLPATRGAINIADLNFDGNTEIIMGGRGPSNVYVFDSSGNQLWNMPLSTFVDNVIIANVTADPYLEVIAGTWGDIRAYSYTGTQLWQYTGAGGTSASPVSAGDLDNDGLDEIVISFSGTGLHIVDDDGTNFWTFNPGYAGIHGFFAHLMPGEKTGVIGVSHSGTTIHGLAVDGTERWIKNYNWDYFMYLHTGLETFQNGLVDWNNDGIDDLGLVNTPSNQVFWVSGDDGRIIDTITFPYTLTKWAYVDLGFDNNYEIITSDGSNLYLYDNDLELSGTYILPFTHTLIRPHFTIDEYNTLFYLDGTQMAKIDIISNLNKPLLSNSGSDSLNSGLRAYYNFDEAFDNEFNFGGGTWNQLSPVTVPTTIYRTNMEYIPSIDSYFTFSGRYLDTTYSTETWLFRNGDWELLSPTTSPTPRENTQIAVNTNNGKLYLYGGQTSGSHATDFWEFDPITEEWTQLSPIGNPGGHSGGNLVYDSNRDILLLYGGVDTGSTLTSSIWQYSFGTNTWTNRAPTGNIPAPRGNAGMVYDSVNDKVLLFGGNTIPLAWFNDTWTYDYNLNEWNQVSTGISPDQRSSKTLRYSSELGISVLHGGVNGATSFSDTWIFDHSKMNWNKITIPGGPSIREFGGLGFNPTTLELFGYGGTVDSGLTIMNSDTWMLKLHYGLKDQTNNNGIGTIVNATYTEGKYGSGLSFDGVDDFVDLNTNYLATEQTISLWVKPNSLTPSTFMVQSVSTSNHVSAAFYISASNMWGSAVYQGDGSDISRVDLDPPANRVWSMMTLVKNPATNTVSYYINGILMGTNAWDGGHFNNTIRNMFLGFNEFYGNGFFDGTLDELRIYDRVLTSTEIEVLYKMNDPSLNYVYDQNGLGLTYLNWTGIASDPYSYEIQRDGVTIQSGLWNSYEHVSTKVAELPDGNYNFTAIFTDLYGNTVINSLEFIVEDYYVDFGTDVFQDGVWTRTGPSVAVSNGNMSITPDGCSCDDAQHPLNVNGPFEFESHSVLISGGNNYVTPGYQFIYSNGSLFDFVGLVGATNGWKLGVGWSADSTLLPAEGEWRWMKLTFNESHISVSVKVLEEDPYTYIASRTWNGDFSFATLKIAAPWDAHIIVDSIRITEKNQVKPTINSPSDVTYNEGQVGNTISWIGTDANPTSYVLYLDGVVNKTGTWNSGVPLVFNVDGLALGVHSYVLQLKDIGGSVISDQVAVTVNGGNNAPTIGTQPTDFSYAEGQTGNSLSWTANDTNPAGYNILMNGTSVDSGSWTSFVPIVLDVDGLTKALYNFTIEFSDSGSLKTTHTVFVTVFDANDPVIVSPSSISYEFSSTGSSLTWTITDNYPDNYDVLRNGTSIDSGLWISGQDITVNVDGLAINTYNFTIIVYDLSGNFAINTVYVTVTSPIAPIVSSPADFSYNEGSAGNTISWDASDDNPTTYTVTRDAVPIDSGSWSSGTPAVNINIDGLVVGVYTFEVEFFEINGLSTVDTVVVTVNDNTNPVISSPNDLSFAYGQTGNTISWTATDNYPDTYSITNNSIPLDSGSWSSGVPIVINVDGQPVGDYTYEITVSDANGNSVSDIVVVSVLDVTPPLITSTPGNIDYFEGSTGNTLSWTAIDNHSKDYFVYRNGTGIDSGSWVSGISNYTNIDGLVRGYYNFTIVFTDESGNFDRDTSIVHVIDNTIPDLDSPLDFIFSEGTSAIDWTAGDRHPFTYTVRVDGGAPSAPIAWTNGTISYDISSLSLGGHSVEITVYDDSGNFAMDTVIVTAQDQTTPLISSPPDVTYFEGQTGYFVSWTPTDLHPTTYVITVNGSQVVGPTSWVSGNAIILDINGYPLGNSTIEITVSDIGGNSKSDIVYVTVLADDTPPTISVEADVSYEAGFSAPLSWTVNDQYPSNYDVYLDGVLINSSISWSTGTLSYPGLILDVGIYTFNITIYDQRGNWASDEIQLIVSDTTSPIVSGNPTVNSELNVVSILIWNVDELYPSNYEIRVDGVLVASDVFSDTLLSYSFNGTSLGDFIVNITVFDESSLYHSYITTVTVADTKIDLALPGQDYVIGENENVTLSFIASDALPSSYELYLNGSLIDSGVWGWTVYEELVIGFGFGEYTYEMIVFDTSGNNATITFIVTVGDDIAPIVSSDGNVEVVYQFTSDGLASWTITEDYPDTFELYRNGSLIESGPLQGNSFVFNASSFEIGYWELTLNVYDTFGNSGSASIIVFVRYIESDAPTFISLPEDEIHHIDDGDFVIQWVVYDAYPNNYSLYQDGELIAFGLISEDGTVSGDNYIIEYIFSPDVVADYEFILVVTDMWGFSSISDVTTIYVLAPQSELSPEIREVNDLVVAITQEEVVIQWIINEENPSSSQLTVDGIADAVRSWDGSIITLTLDLNELGIGSHTVSITVTNTEGYSSTDLVYILIVEGHDSGTAEGFLPFTSMWIILFAFIAVTIIRRRY